MNDYIKHTEDFIGGFKNEYSWLSNMQECLIQWQGMYFMSTEAAYQASKTKSLSIAKKFQTLTGLEAKKHSKTLNVRSDWSKIKYEVMSQLTFQKYLIHKDLRQLLLETGDKYLEETNNWKDIYWGVYNGKGQNNLGKILMSTREYFKYQNIFV